MRRGRSTDTRARRAGAGLALALAASGVAGCGWNGVGRAGGEDFPNARVLDADEAPPSRRTDLKNPHTLDLHYGRLQTEKGRFAEARTAFDRVLADDARSVEALIGLARLEEVSAGDSEAGLAVAEAAFRRAVDAAPDDARGHAALGRFFADRGRWPEAEAAYAAAVRLAPDDRGHRFALAVAVARGGDLDGAREHFVAAVGEAEAHYNLGSLRLAAGQREAAEAEFRAAVLKKPDLAPARLALAAVRPRTPAGTPGATAADSRLATTHPGTPTPAADPFAAAPPLDRSAVAPRPAADPFAAAAPDPFAAGGTPDRPFAPGVMQPDILQAAGAAPNAGGAYGTGACGAVAPAAAVAPFRPAPAAVQPPAGRPAPHRPTTPQPVPPWSVPQRPTPWADRGVREGAASGTAPPQPPPPAADDGRGVAPGTAPSAEPPPWPFR